MKKLSLLTMSSIILISAQVFAESDTFYIVNGKKTESKVDAVKSLIVDQSSQVYLCNAQELTKKATLKKK